MALGFEVRLIPPAHVKPYVRRNSITVTLAYFPFISIGVCGCKLDPAFRGAT